ELEAVHLNEFEKGVASIEVGIIADTKQPAAALHFARYLGARDKGLQRYRDFGFTPVEGDVWADVPELTIYAGSMLRPAIEETIKAFESREGVEVTRIYNGCGILVAQMKGGQHPDAYFACDREFMSQVNDLFPESTDVSTNQLVILVQKGNPHVIQSLKDLAKPGLQVGIGHEKLCAMGWLTQQTFKEGNVQTEVMKNVTVQSPTGDTLVNQLKAGSLDAAVAYLSNAAGSADVLDAIPIQGIPCAEAVQPFGVAVDSEQKHLARRLYQRIAESESKERFLRNGFDWKLEEPRFGED
ncbi:MAG: substrate-binding domain-containing protein, partial [Planctomycetaceae bacterium]|nr:substrate-binding domain-containing protein [Planctomycetaceae bacterium]